MKHIMWTTHKYMRVLLVICETRQNKATDSDAITVGSVS
jgi:hypothetical protein